MAESLSSYEIHEKVRRRYAEISCSLKDRFRYPTGREGAVRLGYDASVAGTLPDAVTETFCGVGNPFSLGPVFAGDTVLDIGCGGGFDVFMARHLAGPEGRVYGIDLVPHMAEKAKHVITAMKLSNCEIIVAGSESLPFDDGTFDMVISNGAIYLSPMKEQSLTEVYRVLKPGGRFQFSDVILKDGIPRKVTDSFNGWSG